MKIYRFSLRKHKLGMVSVVVGALFFLGASQADASEISKTESSVNVSVSAEVLKESTVSSDKDQKLKEEKLVEDNEFNLLKEELSEVKEEKLDETKESLVDSKKESTEELLVKKEEKTEELSLLENREAEVNHKVEVNSVSSNEIISVPEVWEKGYKGEGMVVAIIDSGLDIEHDAMRLSNVETAKYRSEEEIEVAKKAAGITYGKWYSDKVVFGYNYVDANTTLKEVKDESHGMHVTGIAAGNPSKKDGIGSYVYGVAPEAQVMFMRVFVDRSSTTDTPLYARAIEDAVKLGADSINLSLGAATGSTLNENKSVIEAIEKARKAGVNVVIAAGNDGTFGSGHSKPLAENPDYGLVGSPSVAKDAISVASYNNSKKVARVFDILGAENNEKLNNGTSNFVLPGTVKVNFDKEKEYDYVFVNLGKKEDFANVDLKNKVALIKRGEITFTEKIKNAKDNGAIGAVIFNNKTDGDDLVMSIDGEATDIPSVFIPQNIGLALSEATYKLKFSNRVVEKVNKEGEKLSDFSSWGLSSDGELKPDVAAPGGAIYASINNNKYESMNGTSMASPHIAGVALLVKQHLLKTYPDKSQKEIEELVKHLIMSTAKPHFNKESNAYTSPRQQGAGIADTLGAISSTLYLTGEDNYGSITLGNVSDKLKFNVVVHNFGKEERTLSYETVVNTDKVEDGKITLLPRHLDTVKGHTIKVRPNSTETIIITLDTSKFTKELSESMKNGYYLEGFVRFVDEITKKEAVSIPYVGFKGDFQNVPVVESTIYENYKSGKNGFYFELDKKTNLIPEKSAYTGLVTSVKTYNRNVADEKVITAVGSYENSDGDFELISNKDKTFVLAISPNNDSNRDSLGFQGVFLRNYDDLVATVYSKEDKERKNPLWQSTPSSGRKNYFSGNPKNPKSNIVLDTEWSGTDKEGNPLADGKYEYVVSYYSTVLGSKKQEMVFDIVLDREAPVITTAFYDKEKGTLTPRENKETGSGVVKEQVFYKKKETTLEDGTKEPEHFEYIEKDENGAFVLPKDVELKELTYLVEDFAGNRSTISVEDLVSVGNDSGRVFVKLVKKSNGEKAPYTFSYTVKDESGKVVDNIDKSKEFISLPFGTYSLDVLLYDTDNSLLVGETSKSVTLTKDDTLKTVEFMVEDVAYEWLNVDFDKQLPQGSKVSIVDEKGNVIALFNDKYSTTNFGKQVPLGSYTIKVELQDGYELYENDLSVKVIDNIRTLKNLTLINKKELKEFYDEQENKKELPLYYNSSESNKVLYDKMLEATKEALLGKRMQVEIDALLTGLKSAYTKLDGKETNRAELEKELEKAEKVKEEAKYYNASRESQTEYETTLKAVRLEKESKTQKEVDAALEKLKSAYTKLDGKETNRAELEKELEKAEKVKEAAKYYNASRESQTEYETTLKAVRLEKESKTQKEVDAALEKLKVAYTKLDGKETNKEELSAKLKNSEAMKDNSVKYKYASASLKNDFDNLLEKIANVLNKTKATQKEINELLVELSVAENKLDGVMPEPPKSNEQNDNSEKEIVAKDNSNKKLADNISENTNKEVKDKTEVVKNKDGVNSNEIKVVGDKATLNKKETYENKKEKVLPNTGISSTQNVLLGYILLALALITRRFGQKK